MRAPYDEIADWYEHEFLGTQDTRAADPLGIDHCLRALLGAGSGTCLEIACGTGVHAATVADLGWTPAGIDMSAGMLRHARGRLAIARADAEHLPVRDNAVPAVISVMAHTDIPGYPAALREAARVLRPGGVLVHVGVHPCFCGGFADRSDPQAVVIGPGYRDRHWTKAIVDGQGRPRQGGRGALPAPRPAERDQRRGPGARALRRGSTAPTPQVLAVRARKPLWPKLPPYAGVRAIS